MTLPNVRKLIGSYTAAVMAALLVTACSTAGTNQSADNTQNPAPTQNQNQNSNSSEPASAEPGGNLKTNLSIGTSPVGSSLNASGSGIASIVSQHSDVKVSVKPFAGFPAFGPLLDSGEVDLGFDTMPAAVWGFRGEMSFERTKNLRLLARGNFIQETGPIVRLQSGINSVADLRGKRVASDYPAAPTSKATMDAVLDANNVDWSEVRKVPIPTAVGGIEAIRDDRVDAAFMMTPTTPIVVETHNAVGIKGLHLLDNVEATEEALRNVPQETVEKITSRMPGARLTIVQPVGFITEPTVAFEYPTALMASAHLNDETVYEVMKTLYAHYEKLHPIHLWLSSWDPEQMFEPNPSLPYHPGAVKFFKEEGMWNDDMEKLQQELLNAANS